MPRLDGKGPMGIGPKTGRGLGNCEPQQNLTNENLNNDTSRVAESQRPFMRIKRRLNCGCRRNGNRVR